MNERLKEESKIAGKYKPIGILNVLGSTPAEVNVVFSGRDNNLYCGFIDDKAKSDRKFIYDEFYPLNAEKIERVKKFNELKCETHEIKEEYSIGDKVIIAYQIDENNVFVGEKDKYLSFLKQYKNTLNINHDNLLSEEINETIKYYEFKID